MKTKLSTTKKIVAGLVAAMLLVAMVGLPACGGKSNSNASNNTNATAANTSAPANANTTANTSATPAPAKNESASYDSAAFRKSLDAYEEFVDEYVAFMEKYNADPSNTLAMAGDYARMLGKFATFEQEISKIDSSELSAEDLAYYLEVTTRCLEKIASVA